MIVLAAAIFLTAQAYISRWKLTSTVQTNVVSTKSEQHSKIFGQISKWVPHCVYMNMVCRSSTYGVVFTIRTCRRRGKLTPSSMSIPPPRVWPPLPSRFWLMNKNSIMTRPSPTIGLSLLRQARLMSLSLNYFLIKPVYVVSTPSLKLRTYTIGKK